MTVPAFLAPLAAASWDGLSAGTAKLGIHTWVWCDLGGLNWATVLPAAAPYTTCVWGSGKSTWVRARVDIHPLHGITIVGATLSFTQQNAPGEAPVSVSIEKTSTIPGTTPLASRSALPKSVTAYQVVVPSLSFVATD